MLASSEGKMRERGRARRFEEAAARAKIRVTNQEAGFSWEKGAGAFGVESFQTVSMKNMFEKGSDREILLLITRRRQ
jgi:hypothetical protein